MNGCALCTPCGARGLPLARPELPPLAHPLLERDVLRTAGLTFFCPRTAGGFSALELFRLRGGLKPATLPDQPAAPATIAPAEH